MPANDTDRRTHGLWTTLTHRAGNARDARAVAEAALGTWQQMAARLEPVVGAHGVDVLVRRSQHLTSASFPWLAIAEGDGDRAALVESLKARLAGYEAEAAMEASYALLVTFTDLLADLIGESLVERLLGSVWVSPPASEQGTAT